MRASIVIPLYNQVDLTRQCVESILAVGLPGDVELVLVDNASTDGTRAYLDTLSDVATMLLNERNENFSGACNAGAQAARGDVVVFLNNDTVVTDGWLDALLAPLDDAAVGCVGGLLLYPDGSVQHAGVAYGPDRVGFHLYVGAAPDDPRVLEARELQAVTGACMALPRELFLQLGGFDEAYRNGAEDLDLCMQVLAHGRTVRYEPRCVVYHHESRSDGRFRHAGENLALFLQRWADRIEPDAHAFADGGRVRSTARAAAVPLDFHEQLEPDAVEVIRVDAAPGASLRDVNGTLAGSRATRFTVLPPHSPLGDGDARAIAGRLADGADLALALVDDELPVVAFTRTVLDRIGGLDATYVGFGAQLHDFLLRAQACRFAIADDGHAAALASLAARRGGDDLDMRRFMQRWSLDGRRSTRGVTTASPLVLPDPLHYAPLLSAPSTGAEPTFATRAVTVLLAYERGAETSFVAAAEWLFRALRARKDVTVVVRAGTEVDAAAALLEQAISGLADDELVDVVLADCEAWEDGGLCAICEAVICTGLENYALHGHALHRGVPVVRAGDDAMLALVAGQSSGDDAVAAAA